MSYAQKLRQHLTPRPPLSLSRTGLGSLRIIPVRQNGNVKYLTRPIRTKYLITDLVSTLPRTYNRPSELFVTT